MKITHALLTLSVCSTLVAPASLFAKEVVADRVAAEKLDGKVRVTVDGKLFAELDYANYAKPIFWPIVGPTGEEMTRNYPMKQDVKDEARDHPHHKSLLFHHGIINDENFWHEDGDKTGVIKTELKSAKVVGGRVVIETTGKWIGRNDKLVCTDTTTYTLHTDDANNRYIDFDVTMTPADGDLVFGDTKEGSMAIRTHPELRLKGDVAKGKAINSAGDTGKDLWGKKAAWVNYYGPVNGKMCGIAIFDHPGNLRYPTTWHARDYGLIAANPFGLSYFLKAGKNAGNHTVKADSKITFKYRFVFHEGDHDAAGIPALFKKWAL
jgi:hypothetical protein